jgi:hypothetical protein
MGFLWELLVGVRDDNRDRSSKSSTAQAKQLKQTDPLDDDSWFSDPRTYDNFMKDRAEEWGMSEEDAHEQMFGE